MGITSEETGRQEIESHSRTEKVNKVFYALWRGKEITMITNMEVYVALYTHFGVAIHTDVGVVHAR